MHGYPIKLIKQFMQNGGWIVSVSAPPKTSIHAKFTTARVYAVRQDLYWQKNSYAMLEIALFWLLSRKNVF